MFVHISPEVDATGETISTLKFAERVSTVELGAARANKDSADVKELKDQVHVLTCLFYLQLCLPPMVSLVFTSCVREGCICEYTYFAFIILFSQIASLKAALARKEGERGHPQHSRSSSPERFRMKSAGSSPSHPSWRSLKDFSGGRKQPMDDVGNIEVLTKYYNCKAILA